MSDQLQLIVAGANLEPAESGELMAQFETYAVIAAEWEAKARTIVVTSADQKADMKIARIGRLELKEKRCAIERTRKILKESSLRKGKAIDSIAKYLTALIEPTEKYLENQEKFAENLAKQEADRLRKEEEARIEAERIEREKKEAEERAAKEAAEREERRKIQEENDRLRKEKAEQDRVIREQQAQAEADRKKAEKEKAAIEEQARREKAELEAKLRKAEEPAPDAHEQFNVICPKCGHQFNP